MSGIAAAILGAGAIGAGASVFGSLTQKGSTDKAIAAENSMFNTALMEEQPFINAGQAAIPTLQSLVTPGPNQTATLQQTPGFNFISDWGEKGVSNQGTTTGLGGNTLTAGANFAEGLALNNAWLPTINALQSLVTTGAGSANAVGGQAVTTGSNVGGAAIGGGNAIAGGATAAGANVGNALTSAALFSKLLNNSNMYGPGAQGAINSGAQPGISNGGFNFIDNQA